MTTEVHDHPDQQRYELTDDGTLATFVDYQRDGGVLDLLHTETQDGFAGRGLADELISFVLADAREHHWTVRPTCSYVQHHLGKHPDDLDLVSADDREAFEL